MGLGAPGPAAAQGGSALAQRTADYQAALFAFQAHTKAWEAQEQRWQDAQQAIAAAKGSGDQNQLEAADQRAWTAASELTLLQRVAEEAEQVLTTRRRELLAALDDRMDVLAEELRVEADPARRRELSDLIGGHEAQYRQLEAEQAANPLRPTLMYLPLRSVVDQPLNAASAQRVIQLMDRRAEEVQAQISDVEEQIRRFERRLAQRRQAGDAATSLTRFGAGDPVGATPPRGTGAGSEVAAGEMTPEQMIQSLTDHRALLELLLHQIRVYVVEVRSRLPGGGHR
jgi:hypothetical protein